MLGSKGIQMSETETPVLNPLENLSQHRQNETCYFYAPFLQAHNGSCSLPSPMCLSSPSSYPHIITFLAVVLSLTTLSSGTPQGSGFGDTGGKKGTDQDL